MEAMLRDKRIILMFIVPVLILYAIFIPFPVGASIYYGFLHWNLISPSEFAGFSNYISMFTEDYVFRATLRNTFVYMGLSVLLQLPLAFMLAVILTNRIRGSKFFKNMIFLPVNLSGVAISLMWYFIYHPEVGIVNNFLSLVGLGDWGRSWLAEADTALYAVIVAVAWQWIGYHMMLFIGGISIIPGSLIESAHIDGASQWQVVRHILIPLSSPMIKVSLILITTSCLKSFDNIYIMTSGGPAHASEVLALQMYNEAFGKLNYGYGSAIATVLLVLCVIFTLAINRIFYKDSVQM